MIPGAVRCKVGGEGSWSKGGENEIHCWIFRVYLENGGDEGNTKI